MLSRPCPHQSGLVRCAVSGCSEAARSLVVMHRKYFYFYAHRFRRRYRVPASVPVDALAHEAIIAFLSNIHRYDPEHPSAAKLFSYLQYWMWNQMQRSLPELIHQVGNTLTSETTLMRNLRPLRVVSVHTRIGTSDCTIGDSLVDRVHRAPDEVCIDEERNRRVQHALAQLMPLHRAIIELRHLHDFTLNETGAQLYAHRLTPRRMSRERVRTIEVEAERRFKRLLVRAGFEP